MHLGGKLLIAMPGMGDPRFDKSVVFLCAHSDEGAMGLIVNKPMSQLSFAELLEQLDIPRDPQAPDIRVHFGGPVEHGRGFVLHSGDYDGGSDATLRVDSRFGMTATLDVLQAIASGKGPKSVLLALGYAGWGPGQLEGEIGQNGWLTCDADPDLIFTGADARKWERALGTLGIDPLMLSSAAGRA
ncbi:MAG: YqgE/AlgH family protein [Rhodobacteraceae bacterium]|nr:YqgE/AlgH family protein [Paracoccaceae bacterium]